MNKNFRENETNLNCTVKYVSKGGIVVSQVGINLGTSLGMGALQTQQKTSWSNTQIGQPVTELQAVLEEWSSDKNMYKKHHGKSLWVLALWETSCHSNLCRSVINQTGRGATFYTI